MTVSPRTLTRGWTAAVGEALSALTRRVERRPGLLIVPLGMLAVAAAGRYQLGAKSLWFDEAFAISVAGHDWPTTWRILWGPHVAGNMLVYHILQHLWLGLGSSEGAFRSLSVVFAVATVAPLYALAARLFGTWTAGVAVLLLAVNAFFIQYAQEARSYAALAFLAATTSLLLVRALDQPTRLRWAIYTVVAVLAVYTHYFASLLLFAHLMAILARKPRGSLLTVVVVFGAIGLAAIPLFNAARAQGLGISWVSPLTVEYALSVLHWLVGATSDGPLLAVYAFVCGGGILLALFRRLWRWEWFYATMLAFAPIGMALVMSLVRPAFVPRYLIVALPGLIVVAAASLSIVRPRWLGVGGLAALVILAAANLQGWYTGVPKEDWRGAVQYVSANARPGDWLIAYPAFTRLAIDHYIERQPTDPAVRPLYPTPAWGKYFPGEDEGSPLPDAIAAAAGSPGRIWVVYRYAPPAPDTSEGKALEEATNGDPPLTETGFSQLGVRLYEPSP